MKCSIITTALVLCFLFISSCGDSDFSDNLPRITVLPLRNSLIHDERLTGSYLASRPIKNLEGKISFGTITSFRNTWLLNSKTFDGFRPESLTTTEFVFFPDLGLSMDYRLRGLWSLHSEVYFHSTKGQKYREYIYGHYTTRDISLRYSTAALCFKRKFLTDSYLLQGASFNMISGIYFSALHNAEQIISTVPEDIRTQYHNFDFGFWLGGEIEIPLTDFITVSPGLSLSIGIPNISKGADFINGTRNASEGFHLSFNYYLK